MKHTVERETRDARYDHLMLGEVVENESTPGSTLPKGFGFIRVLVPGLLEPRSAPAFPIGRMFGIGNGVHWVPEVSSNVIVFLNQGDVDHPYYFAGPWGAPKGASDLPPQADRGDPDVVVFAWRHFYVKANGKPGSERLTVEDTVSGTKIDLVRSSGDLDRIVTGSEHATITKDLVETVETGDETHTITAGKRTTTIEGDETKTIATGDETTTVALGSRTVDVPVGTDTLLVGVGPSTETIGTSKAITAGLDITLTAGGLISIIAGGAVSLLGAGTSVHSTAAGTNTIAGLLSNTYLGGIAETVVGSITKSVTGAWALTCGGIFSLVCAAIKLGTGVPAYKKLVTEDAFTLWANIHSHAALGAVPTQLVLPGGMPPNIDAALVTTHDVTAS